MRIGSREDFDPGELSKEARELVETIDKRFEQWGSQVNATIDGVGVRRDLDDVLEDLARYELEAVDDMLKMLIAHVDSRLKEIEPKTGLA